VDARTCNACGRKYEHTHANDRCPVCVPKDAPEEVFENHELVDELPDDN
jgi:rubrerythrin